MEIHVYSVEFIRLFKNIKTSQLTEEMIKEFYKILTGGISEVRKERFNVEEHKKLANEAGNMQTFFHKNVVLYKYRDIAFVLICILLFRNTKVQFLSIRRAIKRICDNGFEDYTLLYRC